MLTAVQIRQQFLDFFREKKHTIVPSSSLLPDSPNLLFTNAGMNQFVPIFLNETPCPYAPGRAADTQKCIRAGGKHNDLDDVGLDTYHHTFFEMLGNWSFGDYFKKEAIDWAWELIVERWKFPANRVYATIYNPDRTLGDPAERDAEAWDLWASLFRSKGLDPAVHIVNGNKKDNFWMMGETGPCGPCSELHIDLTPAGDTRGLLVNQGTAECIEIWNLVFIQFNARITRYKQVPTADGLGFYEVPIEWAFDPLPAQHVDTGMGFERVASIIQGTKGFTDFANARISNYDTDIFRPIFEELEKMTVVNGTPKKYASTLPGGQKEPDGPGYTDYGPTVSTHGPTVSSPEATVSAPDSTVSSPRSAVSAPGSMVSSPRPPVSAPNPTVSSPRPTVSAPAPSGTAPRASVSDPGSPVSADQIAVDVAFRVIADHIRTLSFAIADGIAPGNTDRHYVLRRILRRAVRYGRTLGFHEPFFYKLVAVLARTMGDTFPELRARQQHVEEVLRREEEQFNKTLDRGIEIFAERLLLAVSDVFSLRPHRLLLGSHDLDFGPDSPSKLIVDFGTDIPDQMTRLGLATPIFPGGSAFELYDTYGFPLDLTELMARERGLTVDTAGFEIEMEKQRARARAAQKKQVIELSEVETKEPTRFVGYDALSTPAKVLEVVGLKDKTAVILDTSACYAEMGGQVGDSGELIHGADVWRIANTQKIGQTWLHFLDGTDASDGTNRSPDSHPSHDAPAVGTVVELLVDPARRNAIQRHHSVTHLLHWALHEVVSREATQKGSFVGPDKLTFDFNSAALTAPQVRDIERLVNERIVENAAVQWSEVAYAEVKGRADVMQFFGDKYGETVRLVDIGGYSRELCAGTHTRATGEIGLFRIVSEAAIAAGVRRIEAVAGLAAYDAATHDAHRLHDIAAKIGAPVADLEKKIDALLAHQKETERVLKMTIARSGAQAAAWLLTRVQEVNGVPLITQIFPDGDAEYLQAVVDALKSRVFEGVVVLGGSANASVALVASVSSGFTARVQAGKIIQQIAPLVGGKGGGKPDNARGGGKDATQLDAALAQAKRLLETSP